MNTDTTCTCGIVCTCNHYMPPFEAWLKPDYNRSCAADWSICGTSVPKIYERVLDELFVYHGEGHIYDHRRGRIDLWAYNAAGDDYIDQHLGKDPWRALRRYLDRVRVNRIHRLYKEHYGLVTLLSHARAIRNCRTVGLCAQRANRNSLTH